MPFLGAPLFSSAPKFPPCSGSISPHFHDLKEEGMEGSDGSVPPGRSLSHRRDGTKASLFRARSDSGCPAWVPERRASSEGRGQGQLPGAAWSRLTSYPTNVQLIHRGPGDGIAAVFRAVVVAGPIGEGSVPHSRVGGFVGKGWQVASFPRGKFRFPIGRWNSIRGPASAERPDSNGFSDRGVNQAETIEVRKEAELSKSAVESERRFSN